MRRVAVTGIGVISAVGANRESFWRAIAAGENGIRAMELVAPGTVRFPNAAEARDYRVEDNFDEKDVTFLDRFAQFAAVAASVPPPVLEGVLVQRMAPPGVEAFVAARREPLLGPLVVVGLGGTEVEALRDVAMRLAPVSLAEAHAMIDELRGGSLLRSRADVSALAAAVVRLSELAAGLPPGISNVEINPLLVLPRGQGVLMLDAAVELKGGEPW